MFTVLVVLFIIVAVAMVVSILMQSGRGEGLAGAFGGSFAGGAVFGGRGAQEFLTKVTTVLAIIFVLLCIGINMYIASPPGRKAKSVIREEAGQPMAPGGAEQPAPPQPPQGE